MQKSLARPSLLLSGIGILVLCAHPGFPYVASRPWYFRLGMALVGATLILIGVIYRDIRAQSGSLRAPAKAALIVYGIVAGSLLAEAGVRVLEKYPTPIIFNSPRNQEAAAVRPDPVLGRRPMPYVNGQDANGFRNAVVPPRADIVVLGDSQTWGLNALRAEAWPQVLGTLTDESVYNMGVSGYGPSQYYTLSDMALSFSPHTVVVGVYLGNDIWDAFRMVYSHEEYSRFQRAEMVPELRTDRTEIDFFDFLDRIRRLEGQSSVLEWLRTHFSLGRLTISEQNHFEADRAWILEHPDQGAVYENRGTRVILIPGPMTPGLDLRQPRIVEGQRLTEVLLGAIQDKLSAANARLLVVIIPTKETVYASIMADRLTDTYSRYVEHEAQVRQHLSDFLESKGIAYADALATLRAAAARNQVIYTDAVDGHPVAAGYAAIAQSGYLALSALPATPAGSRRIQP